MKKWGLACVLAVGCLSGQVYAEMDLDSRLIEAGAADNNYNVVNEDIFRAYMQYLNADMQAYMEREGKDPNQISFDADGIQLNMRYPQAMDKGQQQSMVLALRTDTEKNICRLMFQGSQVLRKRNWGLKVAYYDVNNQPLTSVSKKMQDCPVASK